MRLYLTTLNPTDSVTGGFLPAAVALGWDVTILTDQPDRYPGCPEFEVVAADVRDPRAVIDVVAAHHRPDVIFSNSDHLQAATALAADYFGLPGKDWRACVTAKNKALTRRALAAVEPVRSVRIPPGREAPSDLPYPVVVKPALGVASEDVVLVDGPDALAGAVAAIRARRPEEVLVAEEFLDGPVRTLETLGDGDVRRVLGGFATTLGPLPHFVEERLDWRPPDPGHLPHLAAALDAAGVGFGVCHTEYAVTRDGPRVIEINYRLIGDNCDFLLADLLGVPLYEWILRVHAGEPLHRLITETGGPVGRGGPDERGTHKHGTHKHGIGMHEDRTHEDGTYGIGMHGTVVSIVAERSGVVTAAPPDISPATSPAAPLASSPAASHTASPTTRQAGPPGDAPPGDAPWQRDGVRLWHRALREIGDHVEVTGTNRDYLGLVRAVGPDRASVDAAVGTFREEHPWVLG